MTTDNGKVVEESDVIFLAIKPVIFKQVMADLESNKKASVFKNKLFISILAGITLEELEKVHSVTIKHYVALFVLLFILEHTKIHRFKGSSYHA